VSHDHSAGKKVADAYLQPITHRLRAGDLQQSPTAEAFSANPGFVDCHHFSPELPFVANMHPLKLTRSILDPVHGLIRLTDEELQVINSPRFQRLRRIKQNGLLSFVFPAATHTRFEHSLGVLCVAESMLQALVTNGQVAAAKSPSEVGSQPLDAIALADHVNPEELAGLFRLVRLSALCHDLGHGPLSHTFEHFAPGRAKVARLLSESESAVFKKLGNEIGKESSERIEHEWMSCVLFAALFREIDPTDQTTPLAVAAAIHNAPELVGDPSLAKLVPLINDLIASAPADADRMDYVERDSRSSGVSYGLFDRSRVLKSFLAYLDEGGQLRLGIKSSGFRAIENFIQARFELFVQVYYHKTNRAVELMLTEIGEIADSQELTVFRDSSLEDLLDDYTAIGDDEFLDTLSGRGKTQIKGGEKLLKLAIDVRERRLWRRVEDYREGLVPPENESQFLLELKQAHPDETFIVDQVKPKATKDLGSAQGAALLFRDFSGIYRSSPKHSWTGISPLIAAMADQEKQIVRIYYRGSDPIVAKDLRMTALKLESKFRA
jgi:HD superfamily phosphohydrolase